MKISEFPFKVVFSFGEIASRLQALAVIAEDPSSVPYTYMAAHNFITPVPEDRTTLLTSHGYQARMWHIQIHTDKTPTHT